MDGLAIDSSTTDSTEGLGGLGWFGLGEPVLDMLVEFSEIKLVVVIESCC